MPARQEGQRAAPAPIQLESGEFLIFCPPHLDARHRPAVTLGRLKHGEFVLHFRVYKRNGRGRYAITSVGCSFKPNELYPIFAKVSELAAVLPELAEALREAEGSC
jgi:hypothetical protein